MTSGDGFSAPTGYDDYADPIGGAPTHTVKNCAVAPRSGTGTAGDIATRGRAGVVRLLTLFAPYGADIAHADRIIISDPPHAGTYEIEGVPAAWSNPYTGREAGMSVALRSAEG